MLNIDLAIENEAEAVALIEAANRLENRILAAIEPFLQGEDARAACAALLMAAGAVSRHVGMPGDMFSHMAQTAAMVNQDVIDGLGTEARLKAN